MVKRNWYIIFGLLFGVISSIFNPAFCQEAQQAGGNANEMENQIMGYLKSGNYDSAIESAKMYLKDSPDNVNILNVLADGYLSKGNNKDARETIKKALDLEPGNAWSQEIERQITEKERISLEKQNSSK